VVVTDRDSTGRAEVITLEGERRRQVRGWEFKIIVGRALGWNVLKSSRFEVNRVGEVFRFRGSGFGHGLGLCQQGAHVMARRGITYRQILNHYFPGTNVSMMRFARAEERRPRSEPTGGVNPLIEKETTYEVRLASTSGWIYDDPTRKMTLSSSHFRITFPATTRKHDVEALLRGFEDARSDILRRLNRASLQLNRQNLNTVVVHTTTQDFMASTGHPWWVAGVTRGFRTELQPLNILRRRGILATTIRHEYSHSVIHSLGGSGTPRWLAEGLSAFVAGEGKLLKRFEPAVLPSESELEKNLENPRSSTEMRSLYAAAYRHVRKLIDKEGEPAVWCRVAKCSR
jgi:stage II sporulation protein D